MSPEQTGIAEARELARLLVRAAEQARTSFRDAVAPLGLPLHLARTVLLLGEPRTMRDIAVELVCDPSHVTGIADQLESRGLAERAPGADRRVKVLHLTADGRALRAQIAAAVEARPTFADELTADQKASLRVLLNALLAPGEGEAR